MNIEDALHEARLAVENAREVRAYHRKRTRKGNKQREDDLQMAIDRVRAAMKPIRSEIGRFPRQIQTARILARQQQLRAASRVLQSERRKLWKMIERTP